MEKTFILVGSGSQYFLFQKEITQDLFACLQTLLLVLWISICIFTGFIFKIEPSPGAHLICHHLINTRFFQNNKHKNWESKLSQTKAKNEWACAEDQKHTHAGGLQPSLKQRVRWTGMSQPHLTVTLHISWKRHKMLQHHLAKAINALEGHSQTSNWQRPWQGPSPQLYKPCGAHPSPGELAPHCLWPLSWQVYS